VVQMVEFVRMSKDDFDKYLSYITKNYADEKAKAGNWSRENAFELAKQTIHKLLPDGIDTEGHYIYSIYNNSDQIGTLWFKLNEQQDSSKTAFLYDIFIYKGYQGKGYGEQTMKKFEDKAKELKCDRISLHVFAHNNPAISLYKKMGYKITNLVMSKEI